MGYRIKHVQRLKGPQFKVQFEWFDAGKRKTREINKDDWARHGFNESMTFDQAAARKDALNAQEQLTQTEKRRLTAKKRLDDEKLTQEAYLPIADVAEFEKEKITEFSSAKVMSYWRCARLIICAVNLPLRDWEPKADKFYRQFVKRNMSPSYVQKVLRLINQWGKFQAYKHGQFYTQVPFPRHDWAKTIAEHYINKEADKGNKVSDPLPPKDLEAVQKQLKPEQYRWLYFSIWFGLRPIEVDLLKQPTGKKTWWVTKVRGVPVLWVYQTKLKGITDPKKRIKYIPCVTEEQCKAVGQIGQPIKRPNQKMMKKVFGDAITLYAGRKGFVALMQSYGQKFENVSSWLGHTKLQRTYEVYFDRHEVKFDKAA